MKKYNKFILHTNFAEMLIKTKNGKRYYKEFKTKEEAITWRKQQENLLYEEVII